MIFDAYHDKIKQLLIKKASNNIAREAILDIKEIDLSLNRTTDLTALLQEWLAKSAMTEKVVFVGKGCVCCVVKREILEG